MLRVVLSRPEFVALIGKLQNIVPIKPSIPITANVLLQAQGGQLILSATDLSLSMQASIEAKVLEEGVLALPGRRLFQLVRELTTPVVEIRAEGTASASILAGSSHFKIQGAAPEEFPTFPHLSRELSFTLGAGQLKELLSRTSFSVSRDETKPMLGAVLLQCQAGSVSFMSTDGKRLSRVFTQVHYEGEGVTSHAIPLKVVEEMTHLLDLKEEPVTINLSADKIALEAGPVQFVGKLMAGQYPNVGRIIPQKRETPIALHREELTALLRQLSLFLSKDTTSVRFSLLPGELHLSIDSSEMGEGKVLMPANYSGEPIHVAFNPHYFLDVLRLMKNETVDFHIAGSHQPGLLTDSPTAEFVVMPMRFAEANASAQKEMEYGNLSQQ